MRIKNICARIDRFRTFERDELAGLKVETAGRVWNRQMPENPRLDQIRPHDVVLGIIEKAHRVDVTGITAVKELRFETPVELVARITERALGRDHRLVQKQLVRPIGKKMPEVLPAGRRIAIGGHPRLDPAVKFNPRCRRNRVLRQNFAGPDVRRENEKQKTAELAPRRTAEDGSRGSH